MTLHAVWQLAFALVVADPSAFGQCQPQWQAGAAFCGINGVVECSTLWDPDGAGPTPARVVFGGTFSVGGGTSCLDIVAWDPATGQWSNLGSSVNGTVFALAVLPTGDLIAGGAFNVAGGVAANRIARWNGTSWSPIGAGLTSQVRALAVRPNGNIVAAGFQIAEWNGSTWTTIGTSVSNEVQRLAVMPNGDLLAGGSFFTIAGFQTPGLARWNGAIWSAVGGGISPALDIRALIAEPNGDILVGGYWGSGVPLPHYLARWNGASWTGIGTRIGQVHAVQELPNGDLIVTGSDQFSIPSRWDGTSWTTLGDVAVAGQIRTLCPLPNGDIVGAGFYNFTPGTTQVNAHRWNGTSWSLLSPGTDGWVYALATMSNGDVIAGGTFTQIGGTMAAHVARWDGSAWYALGAGTDDSVTALAVLRNGDLVAGGLFTRAGVVPASRVATWDGTQWHAMGAGLTTNPACLLELTNGRIAAGGGISQVTLYQEWNGTTWSGSPFPALFGSISAMTSMPNGDLLLGGTNIGIQKWNGTTLQTFALVSTAPGQGSPVIRSLLLLANGDVAAGGFFNSLRAPLSTSVPANGIALWNNASGWRSLGSGTTSYANSLAQLPDGDLIASGQFASMGGVPTNNIARWDGASWSALGRGLEGDYWGFMPSASAVTLRPDGSVVVAGMFLRADDLPSASLAVLATPCPPGEVALGSGCAGSGGNNLLTVRSHAWVGGVFRSLSTGLAAQTVPIAVIGFATLNVPLDALFPEATPGCNGYVYPDLISILPLAAGSAEFSASVPDVSTLAGLTFHHQVLAFEIDATLGVVAVTSTNALSATVGSF